MKKLRRVAFVFLIIFAAVGLYSVFKKPVINIPDEDIVMLEGMGYTIKSGKASDDGLSAIFGAVDFGSMEGVSSSPPPLIAGGLSKTADEAPAFAATPMPVPLVDAPAPQYGSQVILDAPSFTPPAAPEMPVIPAQMEIPAIDFSNGLPDLPEPTEEVPTGESALLPETVSFIPPPPLLPPPLFAESPPPLTLPGHVTSVAFDAPSPSVNRTLNQTSPEIIPLVAPQTNFSPVTATPPVALPDTAISPVTSQVADLFSGETTPVAPNFSGVVFVEPKFKRLPPVTDAPRHTLVTGASPSLPLVPPTQPEVTVPVNQAVPADYQHTSIRSGFLPTPPRPAIDAKSEPVVSFGTPTPVPQAGRNNVLVPSSQEMPSGLISPLTFQGHDSSDFMPIESNLSDMAFVKEPSVSITADEPRDKTPAPLRDSVKRFVDAQVAKINSGDPEKMRLAYAELKRLYEHPEMNDTEKACVRAILDRHSLDMLLFDGYVVKSGDTVESIASANRITQEVLMRVNGLTSATPLAVGSELNIALPQFIQSQTDKINSYDAAKIHSAFVALSRLYDQTPLSDSSRAYLSTMLDKLAVDIIFSNKTHLLEPVYIVNPGDTIASIAATNHLSPELLMKINGLTGAAPVAAGTKLKIVVGCFDVKISASRKEALICLGGLYAARFPIALGTMIENIRGDFVVTSRTDTPFGKELRLDNGIYLRGVDQPEPNENWQSTIRFKQRDAAEVFDMLTEGSVITISD